MKRIKFLDLEAQYRQIKPEIDQAIQQVITSSQFVGGPLLKNFEERFAQLHESNFCIGVGNGTDALEIALEALKLKPQSEVIVPANSFIATSEAVTRNNLQVIFCDVDPLDYTLDIEHARELVGPNTSAIIPVHLYGHPCDMDAVMTFADEFNLKVIEDCAQAHIAEFKGRRVGSFGDFSTFSFYPGKNLGAYGDGGALLTNNEELSTRARMIANHGRQKKYDHLFEGRNSRLDTLQASILNVKLDHLETWTQKRVEIADYYLKELQDIDELALPVRRQWAYQVYHLFVVRTKKRDELKSYLQEQGVQTGIHYPLALPKLEAYSHMLEKTKHLKCFHQGDELLSLPIGEHMTIDDADYVVNSVRSFFAEL